MAQDPKRVVGDWLDRYEHTAGADAAQIQALKGEIRKLNTQQLERFAAWLLARQADAVREQPANQGLRGFGLQPAAAAEPKRRTSLPGLRFIRAGM